MIKKIILLVFCLGLSGLAVFATTTRADAAETSKVKVLALLYERKVLTKGDVLVHFSLVCNLKVGGYWYPVYNSREQINGVVTARGYNQIIVLSPQLAVRQHIEYFSALPLMCSADKLYTWGDLNIDNAEPSGNTLKFSNQAKTVSLSETDILNLPNYLGQ